MNDTLNEDVIALPLLIFSGLLSQGSLRSLKSGAKSKNDASAKSRLHRSA